MHLTRAARWNWLGVIFMWTYAWLTWRGRWADDTGWAPWLRANTARHRTHAAWKVGWYVGRECEPALETLLPWQPRPSF